MDNTQAAALNARLTTRQRARARARRAVKRALSCLAALLILMGIGAAGGIEHRRVGLVAGTVLMFGGILLGALCAWAAWRV